MKGSFWLVVSMIVIMIGVLGLNLIQSSGGNVKIKEIKLISTGGRQHNAKNLYS